MMTDEEKKDYETIRKKVMGFMEEYKFLHILKLGDVDKVQNLINEKIDYEMLSFMDIFGYSAKYGEPDCLMADIIRSNNLQIIKSVFEEPQYQKEAKYPSLILYAISIGFIDACKKNNMELINYYVELDKKYKGEDKGDGLFREGYTTVSRKIISYRHLFRDALNETLNSEYQGTDTIEFILQNKDKYLSNECELNFEHYIQVLCNEYEQKDKANI